MDEQKTNNLVAKHARKYNKAAVHKDRKKALKKGDRKHKGSFDEGDQQNEFFGRLGLAALGGFLQKKRDQKVDQPKFKHNKGLWDHKEEEVDEVFSSTAITNFFKKSGDKKKYVKVAKEIDKGKYTVAKAAQMFDLDGHILQSMVSEWACNTTEKSRRVNGGDKRKKYMKEKQIEEGDEKGLWDRIHAKRKRGESPAKPGEEDYPKTLDVGEENVQEISSKLKDRYRTKARADVDKQYKKGDMAATKGDSKGVKQADRRVMTRRTGVQRSLPKDGPAKKGQMVPTRNEGLKQARKNVGSDSCWDGYKAKGTKMKDGKEVPDCQKESEQIDEIGKTIKKAGQAAKTVATNAVIRPSAQAAIHTGVAQAKDTAKTVSTGAKKVASGAKKVGSAVKKVTTRKPVTNKESMDPRDFTDKAGYIVTITRKGGKEEIKNFFNTKPAAQKYADRVKNTNKVGHVATIYKTDGRKLMKESSAGIEMKSVSTMLDELTKRDQERLAKRKQANLVKRGKAKPEPKPKSEPKDRTYVSNRKGDDDHMIMQLRKAQDRNGNMDIEVAKGKKTKLPKKMIDKLLTTYNKLAKPQDKKRFVTLVNHELRKRAGVSPTRAKTSSDKAMDDFNKMQKKGIPAPRGKGSKGPSAKELRDIERGK